MHFFWLYCEVQFVYAQDGTFFNMFRNFSCVSLLFCGVLWDVPCSVRNAMHLTVAALSTAVSATKMEVAPCSTKTVWSSSRPVHGHVTLTEQRRSGRNGRLALGLRFYTINHVQTCMFVWDYASSKDCAKRENTVLLYEECLLLIGWAKQ